MDLPSDTRGAQTVHDAEARSYDGEHPSPSPPVLPPMAVQVQSGNGRLVDTRCSRLENAQRKAFCQRFAKIARLRQESLRYPFRGEDCCGGLRIETDD